MIFNVNEMLSSFSFILDFVEQGLVSNISNHDRKVAYIAGRIGQKLKLNNYDLFDLLSYSLLHDNGITASLTNIRGTKKYWYGELNRGHCIEGEKNIGLFPFFHPIPNVILYHHEYQDGSGFFGVTGETIPLYSKIIALADTVAIDSATGKSHKEIIQAIKDKKEQFDLELQEILFDLSSNVEFWLNMNEMFVKSALLKLIPQMHREMSYQSIRMVSQIFSNIIDAKSPFTGAHSRGISEKTGILCRYYQYDEDMYWKMRIAADLHDLGKIMVPNQILEKHGKLNSQEITVIQSHPFYTRKALESITGFEEITNWAANHHEKLNGKGYPYGLKEKQLDFNSRMLACVDIYQALTEERPYRVAMEHEKAFEIMRGMARQNFLEPSIVEDIGNIFKDIEFLQKCQQDAVPSFSVELQNLE